VRTLGTAGIVCLLAACGHARPTPEVAAQGAHQFLQAIPYGANAIDPATAAILEASAASSGVGSQRAPLGFLHQSGTQIVDGAGKPVRLVGANLGGTLLWEAWIWGGDFAIFDLDAQSQTSISRGLNDLLGPDATANFVKTFRQRMIGDADFAAMSRMGFNIVRLPINHRLVDEPGGLEVVDRLIDQAEAHGMYVVLDLHAAPGGQTRFFIADPDADGDLWTSEADQEATVTFWQTLAARYKDRAAVAGYDLLNEPDPPDGESLVAMYRRIIQGIRQVDSRHLVFLEGQTFATDFSMFTAPLDSNQVYTFHMYTWLGEDPRGITNGHRALSVAQNVPLWCGEWGENSYAEVRASVMALDLPAGTISGWAFWTWKQADDRRPYLMSIRMTPAWKSVIDWISDP
jgi:hypothetical protein